MLCFVRLLHSIEPTARKYIVDKVRIRMFVFTEKSGRGQSIAVAAMHRGEFRTARYTRPVVFGELSKYSNNAVKSLFIALVTGPCRRSDRLNKLDVPFKHSFQIRINSAT